MSEHIRDIPNSVSREEETFGLSDVVAGHNTTHPDWEVIDGLLADSDNGQAHLDNVLHPKPKTEAERRRRNEKAWKDTRPTDSWVRYDDNTGRWS